MTSAEVERGAGVCRGAYDQPEKLHVHAAL